MTINFPFFLRPSELAVRSFVSMCRVTHTRSAHKVITTMVPDSSTDKESWATYLGISSKTPLRLRWQAKNYRLRAYLPVRDVNVDSVLVIQ